MKELRIHELRMKELKFTGAWGTAICLYNMPVLSVFTKNNAVILYNKLIGITVRSFYNTLMGHVSRIWRRTRRELTQTDLGILEVARKLFLEQGIMRTEMKDIAHRMGCSRSTLYRHFASKDEILMVLATNAIIMFNAAVQIPDSLRFVCGFDALEWQLNSLMETLISHVEDVTFLRDFDCLFTKSYPYVQDLGNRNGWPSLPAPEKPW